MELSKNNNLKKNGLLNILLNNNKYKDKENPNNLLFNNNLINFKIQIIIYLHFSI